MSRKIQQEILTEYPLPNPPHIIVGEVLQVKGSSLFNVRLSASQQQQVQTEPPPSSSSIIVAGLDNSGIEEEGLVHLLPKYRNKIWIKKGSFVLVELYPKAEKKIKIIGDICAILYDKQIQYIHENGLWPLEFAIKTRKEKNDDRHTDNDGDDNDDIWPASSSTEDDEEEPNL